MLGMLLGSYEYWPSGDRVVSVSREMVATPPSIIGGRSMGRKAHSRFRVSRYALPAGKYDFFPPFPSPLI